MTKLLTEVSDSSLRMLESPQWFNNLLRFVLSGGTLVTVCKKQNLNFADAISWIRAVKSREESYDQALDDRNEYVREVVLKQMRAIAMTDITAVFEDDGTIKPLSEWPEDFAASIAELHIEEVHRPGLGEGVEVIFKKLKFAPKAQALKMLGEFLDLFNINVKHDVSGTLEDMILAGHRSRIEAEVEPVPARHLPPPKGVI